MTARTAPLTPGTPTWLDFWSADIPGTAAFFRELLGHDIPDGDREWGGYTVATSGGRYVFGIGPRRQDSGVGQGDEATLYLSTDDVDETFRRAVELGARAFMEPMDIAEHGRMAVVTEPGGMQVAFWQAKDMVGYQAVDELGFPCWQDCISGDPAASQKFYAELFGFTFEPMGGPDGDAQANGEPVVLAKLGEDGHFTIGKVNEGVAPHWVSYLLVADLDASVARAEELGAGVEMEPMDIEFGRFAHLRTPGGAPFGLFQGAQQEG